jgi:hypothetical protein
VAGGGGLNEIFLQSLASVWTLSYLAQLAHYFFCLVQWILKYTYIDSLAQRFEREKTSWCRDSCQLTRFLSPAPFPAPPPPPFTLSCILRLIWKHKQGPCSSPCIGKIIGMTFLCRNVPGFCQQLFTPFFLVSTNSLFSWNLYFRISNPLCFIRLGEPLASNPRLLRFCTQYANDFANPANPVLIPVFLFLNEQWRGGGGVEGSTVKG